MGEVKTPEQILNEARDQAAAIVKKANDDAAKTNAMSAQTFEYLKKKALDEVKTEIAALKRLPDEVEAGKQDPTRDVFTKGKWFRVPVLPVNFYGHKGGV
jgi:hypothetical protein